MKALVFDNGLSMATISDPVPEFGESLVSVRLAGICNTDIEITKGYMQYTGVLGHEFVGTVASTDQPALAGKRVVGDINLGCGECEWCKRGMSRHCPNRTVIGIAGHQGAFAEYIALPHENLHLVPDSVTDEQAVFVEPLAAALEIIEQVHIQPDHRVAVIGDGKLALLIVQILKLTSCDCTVFGKHDHKMDIASQLGFKVKNIANANGDFFYDIVVEASGDPTGFALAQKLIKPRGILVLKSTLAESSKINMSMLVVNEVTIVGSRCGQFDPAIRLLEQGLVQTDVLVEKIYPFSDAIHAFKLANQSALKVLLNFK